MSTALAVVAVEVWFRFEDYVTCHLDQFEEPCGREIQVWLRRYPVLKRTPKGAWLDINARRRFVLAGARKRYACPTIEEARESFLARKAAQRRILVARLRDVDAAVEKISFEFGQKDFRARAA